MHSLWIGFDPREAAAFAVCRQSIETRMTRPVPVHGIVLDDMRSRGLYWRPTSWKTRSGAAGILWDDISDFSMSTEFAIARFLTPYLARDMGHDGWAVFMDCDIMARDNLARMFDCLDERFAVMCVQHDHRPANAEKMDGQIQSKYDRKNWSSVMAFNLSHPANDKLTLDLINSVPGRDLHAFCWLQDEHIGALSPRWNYLVGHTELNEGDEPALVHFTDGYPLMAGYENVQFADEFRRELTAWAK